MTIRHIRIFTAVCRTGSATAAARALYLTEPAVSRALRELESYYGVSLFDRRSRRLELTPAGERLYSYALHISDSFDTMETAMRTWDETGILRAGASVTLGSTVLPGAMHAFREKHPGVTLRAMVANGAALTEALRENRIDIALIEDLVTGPDLCVEEFARDRLVLLLPPGHPLLERESIAMEDLRGQPLLLRESGSVSRVMTEGLFARHGLPVEPVLESISVHAIVQAVHDGLGISLLPEQLVRRNTESGFIAARDIADADLTRRSCIVRHKARQLTASAREFLRLCRETAEAVSTGG